MLEANKLAALGVLIADALESVLGDTSPSAAALLLTLDDQGAMTASALAPILGVTQPTAVRVAEGLVRRGLVARESPIGRTAPLGLTKEGRRRALTLQRARLGTMKRLLAPLTPRKRARLERLLDLVLAEATHSRAFAATTCRLCDHALCSGPDCPVGVRASTFEAAGRGAGTERRRNHRAGGP